MPKTLPAGMQDDLDSGATTHCFCWRITREDTTVMGFTDHDRDLSFDGVTYEANTGMDAAVLEQTTGFSIDNTDTVGALQSGKITESDIAKGLYDNAVVSVFRVDWQDTSKRLILFSGTIGQVQRGEITFIGEVRGLMHSLNQPRGRIYSKTCDADLFDSRCGLAVVSNADYERTGLVTAVSSRRLFQTTDANIIALANAWYTGGLLTWTSGSNAGQRSEIKNFFVADSIATVETWELAHTDITATDGFTLRAGCDKSIETCKAKFDNVDNFRGFPRMPTNDAINAVASTKDNHSGGSWYS